MKAKRIAIVSVLKPVDEIRMARKMSISLANAGYDVHIAGYKGQKKISGVSQYPLFNFRRLSWQRIIAPWKIFFWLIKTKPDMVVTCTHELLIPSVLYKFFKAKVIYDVQENYALNILQTDAFPKWCRNILAGYVRLKEEATSRFIDHFFLAEKGYLKELDFVRESYTILENKALSGSSKSASKTTENIHLIFTGTLADSTGIFEAIQMAEQLYEVDSKVRLSIAGYCHIPKVWDQLTDLQSTKPWIQLHGGASPVTYEKILELINSADAAFVYYPYLPLIQNAIPTKLYEYLANQVPVLLQEKEEWNEIANLYPAAISVDPENFYPKEVLKQLRKVNFYRIKPGKEVLWDGEAERMLRLIQTFWP